ncbi:hypothetical protein BDR06DRAFT_1004419 [Suillus hirtellus]|nr:hypothetical protein BDR06DRAFT_1004419 [Suillus hirtellus]
MSGLDAIINRKAPSPWELLKTNPSLDIASKLYNSLDQQLPRPLSSPVRTICISDTHNANISPVMSSFTRVITHFGIPLEGRSWVHAWQERCIIYLEDDAHTIYVRGRAFKIFGSPFTPQHGNGAFQYPRVSQPLVYHSKRHRYSYHSWPSSRSSRSLWTWLESPACTDTKAL